MFDTLPRILCGILTCKLMLVGASRCNCVRSGFLCRIPSSRFFDASGRFPIDDELGMARHGMDLVSLAGESDRL